MNLARATCAMLLALAPALAAAASPFDGFWMKVNADKSLDPGSQVEFRVERNILTMATPAGQGYRAKLDGKSTFVETAKLDGKAWLVTTMEVQADGKTAKVTWKNLKNNASGSYVLSKQ